MDKMTSTEVLGMDPEGVKSSLRGVCQAIANAATDDANVKCNQLTNHEYFRDVHGSREEYRSLLGRGKDKEAFEPGSVETRPM